MASKRWFKQPLCVQPWDEAEHGSSEERPTLSMSQLSQPDEQPTGDWGKITIEFPRVT